MSPVKSSPASVSAGVSGVSGTGLLYILLTGLLVAMASTSIEAANLLKREPLDAAGIERERVHVSCLAADEDRVLSDDRL